MTKLRILQYRGLNSTLNSTDTNVIPGEKLSLVNVAFLSGSNSTDLVYADGWNVASIWNGELDLESKYVCYMLTSANYQRFEN